MIFSKITFGLLGTALTAHDYINEAKKQLEKEKSNARDTLVKVMMSIEQLNRRKSEYDTQQKSAEAEIRAILRTVEAAAPGDAERASRKAEQVAARLVSLKSAAVQLDNAIATQQTNANRTRDLIHAFETKEIELETQIGNLQTAELVAQVTGTTAVAWDKNSYRKFMAEATRIVNEKYDLSQAQVKSSEMLGEQTDTPTVVSDEIQAELKRIKESL